MAEDRSPGRRWRLATAAACLTALFGATAVASVSRVPAASATPSLAVHVSGNHLVDGSGAAIRLRGVDLSGTEYACIQGGTYTNRGWSIYGDQPLGQESTYQAIAAWGANVVRVPLNEDCWLGINGVNPAYGGSAYRQAVETEVSLIHEAGMYAILDLHWSAAGPYAAYGQQGMADADHSVAFWQSVATAFKADPGVIFDLFNEPFMRYNTNAAPWPCWLNGCNQDTLVTNGQVGPAGQAEPSSISYDWQSAGMQQLVDAVRSAGATQPILVGGLDWANDDSEWAAYMPSDPQHQLIVGWHSYPENSCNTASCWNSTIAPLAQSHPVLVGETGDSTAGPETYLPTFLPWADAHGLSVLAWTWDAWDQSSNVLIKDWSGTPTAGEGAYFKGWLASSSPSPPTTTTITTTTTLSAYPSAPTAGQEVTLEATVSPSSARGTVAFEQGSATISGCGAQALVSGTATCTTNFPGGVQQLSAAYAGSTGYSASSGDLTLEVGPAPLGPAPGLTPGAAQAPDLQEMVAVTRPDRSVAVATWTPGGQWSSATDIGGRAVGGPTVVSPGDGQWDVFVRGLDGSVWERTYSNGQWRNWTSLGGQILGKPAVALDGSQVAVVAKGPHGHVWERMAEGGGWWPVGGTLYPGTSPAVAAPYAGHLAVFGLGTDDALWYYLDGRWAGLGGRADPATPGASSGEPGAMESFVRGTDRAVWQRSWTGSGWSRWYSLGGICTGGPALAYRQGSARQDVYILGTDDQVWHLASVNGQWGNWTRVP